MSIIHGGAATPSYRHSDRVRLVDSDAPLGWLEAGWRDFLASPATSAGFGLVFAVVGLALTVALWRTPFDYMLLPLVSGFMLIGPVATAGFQAMSRDLENGRRPSLGSAFSTLRANAGPIFWAALAFLFLFLIWLRISELLFALTFPAGAALERHEMLRAAFLTIGGLEFLALFALVGLVFAVVAFAGGAFALSMLVDRPVGAAEAIVASFAAVWANPRAMAVWAAFLVALTAAGMAVAFVGLVVALPVAGHASWRAYRAVIRP